MRILTVNCGSSSLKVSLRAVDGDAATMLAGGTVEAIGDAATITVRSGDEVRAHSPVEAQDHASALAAIVRLLPDPTLRSLDGVGHRVVQGGVFAEPAAIDAAVLGAIEAGQRVAPLHNRPALDGIAAARELFPGVPMVAVFDTTFHNTLPPPAAHYALPHEITRKHGLRRHGYHGIAHRSMTERYAELAAGTAAPPTIITLQLGSGCSATAVREGVSVDTSMGFTPLEGLVMGTRPGDVDPGALTYLLRDGGMSGDDLEDLLHHRSGLLGVSGSSADMAVLLEQESGGQPRAHEAIELFCYRVRKYIGAYIAVLGHVEGLVFGGGIGEHAPEIRRRICEPLSPLGVRIDAEQNERLIGGAGRFSRDDSAIAAWVIPSDEERIIAADTAQVLARTQPIRRHS